MVSRLGIYHFNRTLQSCGSGRQDCINLTMRRIPRVNQEVLLRATFLGWSAGLFFRSGSGDERRPTGRWTPRRRGPFRNLRAKSADLESVGFQWVGPDLFV